MRRWSGKRTCASSPGSVAHCLAPCPLLLGLETLQSSARMGLATRNACVVLRTALLNTAVAAVLVISYFFKRVLGNVRGLARKAGLMQVVLHAAEVPEDVAVCAIVGDVPLRQGKEVLVGDEVPLPTALAKRIVWENLLSKSAGSVPYGSDGQPNAVRTLAAFDA